MSEQASDVAYLLHANVVIALLQADHVHHERAQAWYGRAEYVVATTPVTEGALVRIVVRSGGSVATAQAALRRLHEQRRHRFVPDSLSYAEADLTGVIGHRQATDAYLVALSKHHELTLATLDEALATVHPDALLVP